MRKRLVHRVVTMIAYHHRGDITLLTTQEFSKWREIVMPDLTALQRAEFAMAVVRNAGRDGFSLRRWEKKFCKRLGLIDWIGLRRKDCDFSGEDARCHVDDFLEAYQYRHKHTISIRKSFVAFSQEETSYTMPKEAMTLITVSIHKPRTFIDRILNRLGETEREIEILEATIETLVGQGHDFVLKAGSWYLFGKDGIDELEDEAAEAYVWSRTERKDSCEQ